MIAGVALAAGIACAPPQVAHDVFLSWLSAKYSERVVAEGIAGKGKAIIEITVSKAGTWTVVVTDSDGCSGIIASGMAWTVVPEAPGDAT